MNEVERICLGLGRIPHDDANLLRLAVEVCLRGYSDNLGFQLRKMERTAAEAKMSSGIAESVSRT